MRALAFLFHDVFERDPAESGFSGRAADRYKLSVGEFEVQLNGLARMRHDAPILLNGQVPARHGHLPFILTVDDGGVSFYTQMADRLEAYGWRAHCFVTTDRIGRRGFLDRGQIRELHSRGHVIGSHSASHPTRFSACGWVEMVWEWSESRQRLADVIGADVTVASIPGGYWSPQVAAAASRAGLRVLFTSEPTSQCQTVEGCSVVGRFGVRRGCRPDFVARLAGLETAALLREWMVWNGKKLGRRALGGVYPLLTGVGT